MKNLLLTLLLLPALAAAKVPVEEDIVAKTSDPDSPFYYTSLMMRYNAGDETLTDEDYHYLYYGYAYQESYKPLDSNPDLDKLLAQETGLPVIVAEDPLTCVARGGGRALEMMDRHSMDLLSTE